jgi:hypothetical protein
MLSQDDGRQLAQLEQHLRREDPAFVARMLGRPRPRRVPLALVLASALIWAVAFSLVAAGWWAAAIVVAIWATVISCALIYRCRPGEQESELLPPIW